jgi:hypothetical protein
VNPPWTAKELDRAKSLWLAGRACKAIGAEINRTGVAVKTQARRLGWPPRHPKATARTKVAALRLMRAGRSNRHIARRLGPHVGSLARWRRAAGIAPTSRAEINLAIRRAVRRAPVRGGVAAAFAGLERTAAAGWPWGASPAEGKALAAFEGRGPMTVAEAAETLGLRPNGAHNSFVDRRLRRLWRKGWLVRVGRNPIVYTLAEAVRDRREARAK